MKKMHLQKTEYITLNDPSQQEMHHTHEIAGMTFSAC